MKKRKAVIQSMNGANDQVYLGIKDYLDDPWGDWVFVLRDAKVMDFIEANMFIAKKIKEGGSQCPPVWKNAVARQVEVTITIS